jgi:predicted secreted protein
MEKQQTSVEWLINEIKIARKLCDDPSMEMDIWHTLDVLIAKGEQANQMEKEQIIDAWEDGQNSFSTRNAEKYYNETFKK